jgi:hypothetical protein
MRLVLVAVIIAGVAQAQLPPDQQRCVERYNKALRKVAQQAGKDARRCIRNASKGDEADPDGCVAASGTVLALREADVVELFAAGGLCAPAPAVIVQGAAAGIAAHRGAVSGLLQDYFGDPFGPVSGDSNDARCLDRAIQRSSQALTEILKAHHKCKKAGLKAGTIDDEASLTATCGTLAQIDLKGRVGKRLLALDDNLQTRCAAAPSGIAALFDGLGPACHASPAALSACAQAATRCRACEALNAADGTALDCDAFDDGTANVSCGAVDLGTHACTLHPDSRLNVDTQGLPLSLTPSGTLSIACGTTDADGSAPCDCAITTFAAQVIPAIGDVCVQPAAGCPSGAIDCDGGAPRDVALRADHDVGACTGTADCAATCDAHCAGLGAGYARTAHGCEGFCQGGANADAACGEDSDCPGGDCVGPDFGSHAGACNCVCSATGLGAAAGAGQIACQLGFQVEVELPSNGVCGGAVAYTLPPQCMALTSADASGLLTDANRTTGKTLPSLGANLVGGEGLACEALAASTTSGLELVGHLVWFDTTLGDFFSTNALICE